MLTKERFQEVDTPNLVLNLCSYREDIEKYDFLQLITVGVKKF